MTDKTVSECWARIGLRKKDGTTEWPILDGNGKLYTRPIAATVGLDDKGHFFVVAEGQQVSEAAVQEMRESLRPAKRKTKKSAIRPFDEKADGEE